MLCNLPWESPSRQGWAAEAAKGLGRRRGAALGAGSGRAGQRQRDVLHNPRAGMRLPGQAGPSRCAGLRWELAVPGVGTFLPQGCQEKQPRPELRQPHRDVGAAAHRPLSCFPVARGCRALLDCTQMGMSFISRALCLLAVPWLALVLATSGRRRARD